MYSLVATIAPMKRGLKADGNADTVTLMFDVATIAPMKRGLKAMVTVQALTVGDVATIAPMKRGLKEHD